MIQFEGTIRAHRRGGWKARGVVFTQRHGQIFETQIGPREFESEEASQQWLQAAASSLSINDARIRVEDAAGTFHG